MDIINFDNIEQKNKIHKPKYVIHDRIYKQDKIILHKNK
jgi:hypothetical protein